MHSYRRSVLGMVRSYDWVQGNWSCNSYFLFYGCYCSVPLMDVLLQLLLCCWGYSFGLKALGSFIYISGKGLHRKSSTVFCCCCCCCFFVFFLVLMVVDVWTPTLVLLSLVFCGWLWMDGRSCGC